MRARRSEDRRAFERIDCKNVLVVCKTSGALGGLLGKKLSGGKPTPVDDISRTGLSFFSKGELKPGQRLEMTVDFGRRGAAIELEGEAVWCGKGGGRYPYKAGVRYTRLLPEVWVTLSELEQQVAARETAVWRLRSQDRTPQPLGAGQKSEEARRAATVASIFANLDEDESVAELKRKLAQDEVGPAAATRRAKPSAEQAVLREIHRLEQALDAIDAGAGALRAFLMLRRVSDEFAALAPVELKKAGARELEQLAARLQSVRAQVVSRWDESTRAAAERIAMRAKEARRCLNGICERLGLDAIAVAGGKPFLRTADVNVLAQHIKAFRTALSSIPDAQPDSVPLWRLLVDAGRVIVQPYLKNLFLFRCAIAVSRADGQLAAAERDFLFGIADGIHLSRAEAGRLMDETRDAPTSCPRATPEEIRYVVDKLYLCAMTDGVVSPSELHVLKQLARNWGGGAADVERLLDERAEISELMTLARKCLQRILATSGTEKGAAPEDESFSMIAEVKALSDLMGRIEALAADLPDTRLADLPGWELLTRAQEGIIKQHWSSILLLKAAILLSLVDGEMKPDEREFIDKMAAPMHLTQADVDVLVQSPEALDWSTFELSRDEAHDMVHVLHDCAVADGAVDAEERQFFQEAVRGLGLTERDVADILEREEQAVAFLDRDKVERFLAAQQALPEHVLALGLIRKDMGDRLRRQLAIPAGQHILLCYENRLLASAIECAVLTPSRVYLRTSKAEKKVVSPRDIMDCTADEDSSKLELTGGRVITMSREAEPFLKLLVECVRQSLRTL